MKKLLLSALLSSGLAAPALAAVDKATEQRAGQLLSAGQPAEAVQLLRARIGASDNAQTWFLMGKASEQSGDLNGAAAAYRQVLVRDPNAQRVKLDLERAGIAHPAVGGGLGRASLIVLEVA